MSGQKTKKKQQSSTSLTEVRRQKIKELQDMGVAPFATDFVPDTTAQRVHSEYESSEKTDPSGEPVISLAGRIMAGRNMGKISFMRLKDASGEIQIFMSRDNLGVESYNLSKKLDIGDIVGVRGRPFRTKTNELTLLVDEYSLLTKSMRPLPEKWHGLSDVETRYRQRYVDLIVNPRSREIVTIRSQIINYVRKFLQERGFLEVETPMMQPIPGGATAKPFETYHHALDRALYLRVAPELYLKRLLVGGFERVFEINRNFRNEGVSTQHNPEFTMLEFYQAYATYEDLMELTEEMIHELSKILNQSSRIDYQGREVDLTRPWRRLTVREALLEHTDIGEDEIDDFNTIRGIVENAGLEAPVSASLGKLWMLLFDEFVEDKLWGPVFIHKYPVEVSPLARRNDSDPTVTDRFELYICGKEMANAFTELTDPIDQRSRFEEQVRARAQGDEEAHYLDEDFVRALEYGMPPAAGEGIGIDRVVMLFTDSNSIREVILFPHMRPERGSP